MFQFAICNPLPVLFLLCESGRDSDPIRRFAQFTSKTDMGASCSKFNQPTEPCEDFHTRRERRRAERDSRFDTASGRFDFSRTTSAEYLDQSASVGSCWTIERLGDSCRKLPPVAATVIQRVGSILLHNNEDVDEIVHEGTTLPSAVEMLPLDDAPPHLAERVVFLSAVRTSGLHYILKDDDEEGGQPQQKTSATSPLVQSTLSD